MLIVYGGLGVTRGVAWRHAANEKTDPSLEPSARILRRQSEIGLTSLKPRLDPRR